MKQARKENPAETPGEAIEAASKIGALISEEEPKKKGEKERFAVAQEAARNAIEELHAFLPPAVERQVAWDKLSSAEKFLVHWRIFAATLLKSDLWETLAIIGVTQIVVLPFVGCGFMTRVLATAGLGVAHALLSYWFNWDFLYGINDNWMSRLWMTGTNRSWDGGFFGPLGWGVAMMAGTLAYDLFVVARSRRAAFGRLVAWGVVLMVLGYAMSCLTRVYELSPSEIAARKERQLRQDAERGWLSHLIEQQEERLKELRKPLDDLKGAISAKSTKTFWPSTRNSPSGPRTRRLPRGV